MNDYVDPRTSAIETLSAFAGCGEISVHEFVAEFETRNQFHRFNSRNVALAVRELAKEKNPMVKISVIDETEHFEVLRIRS